MVTVYPSNSEELAETVRTASKLQWMEPSPYRQVGDASERISLANLTGLIEHHSADQVVVVRGGETVRALNERLQPAAQCIPYGVHPEEPDPTLADLTVADALCLNLPHASESTVGRWSNWVLGLRCVLGDGTTVKFGSQAVKNVAGYDLHRFWIGSRGVLGIPFEVTLRVWPTRSLRHPPIQHGDRSLVPFPTLRRVLRADFNRACETLKPARSEPETGLLWGIDHDAPRFSEDRQWSPVDPKFDPPPTKYLARAKAQFDPENRLQPGEFD